jgi:undecaprenyl-diphosphatase
MRRLVVVLVVALIIFIALTIVVTSSSSLAIDAWAFRVADHVRAPWLDHFARLITTLGLLVVVGPVVLVAGVLLIRWHRRGRAFALVGGAALTWLTVWITKALVDRPRPAAPLVHTTGQSFPSAHAANATGWLALAIALSVMVPARAARFAAVACGALLSGLVGLSRIYLRAHYLSDVLAGEALGTAMYAAAAIIAMTWSRDD